jgi:hypothetical protein
MMSVIVTSSIMVNPRLLRKREKGDLLFDVPRDCITPLPPVAQPYHKYYRHAGRNL